MKQLSIRRPNKSRSEFEAHEDFLQMVQWKQQGLTFDEITLALNEQRDYFTTERENSTLYYSLIKSHILIQEVDDAVEIERERLIDDLEWVKVQAQRAYTKMRDMNYKDEISGKYENVVNIDASTTNENEEGEDGEAPKPKKWLKRQVGIIEQHHAKYLDLVLKAIDLKAKITGIGGELERKDFTIIEILKSRVLDDGNTASVPALTSEDDVRALYLGLDKKYPIEETIEVELSDDFRETDTE